MKKLLSRPSLKYSAILLAVSLYIIFVSYEPGTWLTGWDNHHPEFNFSLNIVRDFTSAWRQDRGLGMIDGISHAADLPREIFLWVVSFFLPDSVLRYFSNLIMLPFGVLGMFVFLRTQIVRQKRDLIAFLGALFYVFNLGTVQNFHTPLSTFTVLYGFLPWLFNYAVEYLKNRRPKDLLIFAALSLLATPLGYTATLYFVYLGFLTLLGLFALAEKFENRLKSLFSILLVSLFVNSFWLLPFSYFAITKSNVVQEAITNKLSSEEVFYRNRAYGNISDFTSLRGYQLSAREINLETGRTELIYEPWLDHINKNSVILVGYFLFAFVFLGFFVSIFSKRREFLVFGAFFSVVGLFLISGEGFIGAISSFVRELIPLIGEVLRFPYTKFSIFGIFSFAVLFALGFGFFEKVLRKSRLSAEKLILSAISIISIGAMTYLVFPIFFGNLIYEGLFVDIPNQYFEFFEHMEETDSNGRILYLPIYEHWPWRRHSWGYVGSGFLRYGLENPLVDRAFDVWSPFNQKIYEEIKLAQLQGDTERFFEIIAKYKIDYLLLDGSIINQNVSDDFKTQTTVFYGELFEDSRVSHNRLFGEFLDLYNVQSVDDERSINQIKLFSSLGLIEGPVKIFSGNNSFILEMLVEKAGTAVIPNLLESGDAVRVSLSVEEVEGKGTKTLVLTSVLPELSVSGTEVSMYIPDITKEFTVTEDYLVTLGDTTFGPVQKDFVGSIGSAKLRPNSQTILIVSSSRPDVSIDLLGGVFDDILFGCGDPEKGEFELRKGDGNIEIETRNNLACVNTGKVGREIGGLISVSLTLEDITDSRLRYCLISSGECLNFKKDLVFPFSKNFVDFTYIGGGAELDTFEIYVDPILENEVALVKISNIELKQYPTLYESFVELSGFESSVREIDVVSGDIIKVEIPMDSVALNIFGERCSVNLPEKYLSGTVSYSSDLNEYIFNSLNATGCFKASLEGTSLSGLLISLDVENISGMKPILCVRDTKSEECVVQERLEEGKVFVVVNPTQEESRFDFEIRNPSFANFPTSNNIKNVAIAPLPTRFLEGIRVESLVRGEILTNNSGYDDGWVLLCGFRLCDAEHILVDNWENGWILYSPEDEGIATPVFLPEILRILGYIVLVLVFVRLSLNLKKKSLTPINL